MLASARTGTAVVRDIDGFTLALVPKRDFDLLIESRSMLLAFLTADGAASSHASTASAFGAFAWMASLDEEDREECLTDLREGLMLLAAGDDGLGHSFNDGMHHGLQNTCRDVACCRTRLSGSALSACCFAC